MNPVSMTLNRSSLRELSQQYKQQDELEQLKLQRNKEQQRSLIKSILEMTRVEMNTNTITINNNTHKKDTNNKTNHQNYNLCPIPKQISPNKWTFVLPFQFFVFVEGTSNLYSFLNEMKNIQTIQSNKPSNNNKNSSICWDNDRERRISKILMNIHCLKREKKKSKYPLDIAFQIARLYARLGIHQKSIQYFKIAAKRDNQQNHTTQFLLDNDYPTSPTITQRLHHNHPHSQKQSPLLYTNSNHNTTTTNNTMIHFEDVGFHRIEEGKRRLSSMFVLIGYHFSCQELCKASQSIQSWLHLSRNMDSRMLQKFSKHFHKQNLKLIINVLSLLNNIHHFRFDDMNQTPTKDEVNSPQSCYSSSSTVALRNIYIDILKEYLVLVPDDKTSLRKLGRLLASKRDWSNAKKALVQSFVPKE